MNAPHIIRNGKADRPGSGIYGRLTGDELQAALAHRTRLRHAYDAAEFRYIAAKALLKAAEADAEAESWSESALESVAEERECLRDAENKLRAARDACEAAGVTVNTHQAMSLL